MRAEAVARFQTRSRWKVTSPLPSMTYKQSSAAAFPAELAMMEGTKRLGVVRIASIAAVGQSLYVVDLDGLVCATALDVRHAHRMSPEIPGPVLVDVVGAVTATLTRRAWECLVWITGRVRGAVPALGN
jgi:hypothetical protein